MDKIRLYSPIQVAVGTFFGGPFAAVFTLWQNFRALGHHAAALHTLVWGVLFNVALLGILPVLPDKFPNLAIPIACTVTAYLTAQRYQMTKQAILASEQHEFRSNWNVFGICIGFLLAFVAVFGLWIFALIELGLVT